MSKEWKFDSGEWWVICDICSRKVKASQAKHRWDGFVVCPDDYEERHSLDFIRTRNEDTSVPFSRNINDSIVTSACSIPGKHPYAGYATAGCAIIEFSLMSPAELDVEFPT
jgi:hypothetical protein